MIKLQSRSFVKLISYKPFSSEDYIFPCSGYHELISLPNFFEFPMKVHGKTTVCISLSHTLITWTIVKSKPARIKFYNMISLEIE